MGNFRILLRAFLLAVVCFYPGIYYSQSVYSNLDFESGNLTGWSGATGFCCPIEINQHGFSGLQHTIMNGNGFDPYSLGQIPVVAPGGNFSLRLGNDSVHSEAERASYTFTVLPEAPLIVYRYAVVFEFPPDHPAIKQPRFEVSVKNQNGELIDCGFYSVVSSDNIPGFVINGDYRFKPWTEVGVDLSGYIGQQITFEFSTGDCGMGGHFGYAYIDGYASELKITRTDCHPDGSITFTAPPGFNYLWSNGGTTQQINLIAYNGGEAVSVELMAATGCTKTLSIQLPDFVPVADFAHHLKCDFEVEFQDASVANNTSIISYYWDFGDGNNSSQTNPVHSYSSFGIYPVILTIHASNNCRGKKSLGIPVESLIKAEFTFSAQKNFCRGSEIVFTDLSLSMQGNIKEWFWDFGDVSESQAKNPSHVYIQPGAYTVSLMVTNETGCKASSFESILIYPEDSCMNFTTPVFIPNCFTPNGDGRNDFFEASGFEIEILQMEIFDRWGRQIFYNSDSGKSWNGKLKNNKPAPEGIYTYKISTRIKNSDIRQINGHVLLLR